MEPTGEESQDTPKFREPPAPPVVEAETNEFLLLEDMPKIPVPFLSLDALHQRENDKTPTNKRANFIKKVKKG